MDRTALNMVIETFMLSEECIWPQDVEDLEPYP